MVINKEKLKDLNPNDIYMILKKDIENIYKSFSYLDLSYEEYKDLSIKEIIKSYESYQDDNILYVDFLCNNIRTKIIEHNKSLLNNNETSFKFVNNFINSKLKLNKKNDNNVIQIELLNIFFEENNYNPNPKLIAELLNNNDTLKEITKRIVKHNNKKITKGELYDLFECQLIITIIEEYCMINDIEISNNTNDLEDNSNEMSDSVKSYLFEIGQYPLLTREEEVELSNRIKNGDNEAKKKLIESNLRLVVSIAKRFSNKALPLLDLIQEGNIGLMLAIEKYNVDYGFRFSTYASHWIMQTMTRAIAEKGRIVRIPVHINEKLIKYNKVKRQLEDKYNREVTLEEIAKEMNISINKLNEILKYKDDVVSINKIIGEEHDSELGDFISSDEDEVDEVVIKRELSPIISDLFDKCNFTEKEKDIMILRYGFNGKPPSKLEDIASKYSYTRERIRQIEAKCLKKIRSLSNIKELALYAEYPADAAKNIDSYRKMYLEDTGQNKAFLRNYGKNSYKSKRSKTFYEHFPNYTKEQIDAATSNLTIEEKEIIKTKYGEKLELAKSGVLSYDEAKILYGNIIPMIKKCLKNPDYKRKKRRRTTEIKRKTFGIENETSKSNIKNINSEKIENKIENNLETSKEVYERISDILKSSLFDELSNKIGTLEATIFLLKIENINTADIAELVEISQDEVLEITKSVITLHKDELESIIDKILDIATSDVEEELTKALTFKKMLTN